MVLNWLTDCLDWQMAYVNFSVVLLLKSCHIFDTSSRESKHNEDDEPVEADDDLFADTGDTNTNSLWTGLQSSLSWFGSWGEESVKEEYVQNDESRQVVGDDCTDLVHSSVGGSASVVTLVEMGFILLTLVILFPFIVRKVRNSSKTFGFIGKDDSLLKQSSEKEEESRRDVQAETDCSELQEQTQQQLCPDTGTPSSQACHCQKQATGPPKSQMPVIILLQKCSTIKLYPDNSLTKPDTAQLITHTVDHFLMELDRTLGLTAPDGLSSSESMPAFSATSTPRVERKSSIRRAKWRSPHSLPLGAASVSSDDKMSVRMWQRIEDTARRMAWSILDINDIDISLAQDNRLSAVLQFCQQSCPVRAEQWSGACLIVNYFLSLLEQELSTSGRQNDPLRILELRSFGSAASKTCISRADRFDVMMVLQLPSCREMSVFHWGVSEEIPAGRLILGIKEHTVTSTASSQLLIKDRVGNSFGLFLSQKEVVKAAHKMVSNALERLRSKGKGSLERLPLTVHMSAFEDLVLRIDTRTLNGMGLGVPEITINLTPSFSVSSAEFEPLPVLYAVPPVGGTAYNSGRSSVPDSSTIRSRLPTRIMRNRTDGIPAELLWQLNCTELTKSFLAAANSRLTTAGVQGCQVMCQQILRALFSRSGKDKLLTSGEVHPYVLDTIVSFLLLESPPDAWSLSSLPDRMSDCVHFLRSAVQSAWMPDFHLHNPHLLKQMPALKLLPLLNVKRQENLLTNLGPDSVETILAFLEARLQETGLRRCLKTEYSSEMWEYEFFIFG